MNAPEIGGKSERFEPASRGDRFWGRAIDLFIVAVVEWVTFGFGFKIANSVFGSGVISENGWLMLVLLIVGSIPMILYEVIFISRRGYTFGKGPNNCVVRWDTYIEPNGRHLFPSLRQSLWRWALPHVSILLGAVLIWQVAGSSSDEPSLHVADALGKALYELFVMFIIGVVSFAIWMTVYLSSLFDQDGRGWHDKVAGTIVVTRSPSSQPLFDPVKAIDAEPRNTTESYTSTQHSVPTLQQSTSPGLPTRTSLETTEQQKHYELASPGDRFYGRAIDSFITMVGWGVLVAVITQVVSEDSNRFIVSTLLVFGSILIACYEVVLITRRGATFGKNNNDQNIQVIHWDSDANTASNNQLPSYTQSLRRWMVPHGSILFGSILIYLGWDGTHEGYAALGSLLIWGGLVFWLAVYLSSLFDQDGRGWHDKAAGTIVVKAPRPDSTADTSEAVSARSVSHGSPPRNPSSLSASTSVDDTAHLDNVNRWDVKISGWLVESATKLMGEPKSNPEQAVSHADAGRRGTKAALAIAATVTIAGVFLTVIALVPSGIDKYDDNIRGKYDDNIRGTGGSQLVDFGQRIGPDGDGCWPERGRVFCDLVSIGGLHWDAGNTKIKNSADMILGSGFLCLIDVDGAPWCWEWTAETPPQPVQTPSNVALDRILGNGGLYCGQTTDNQEIVCWTVGADHPEYRQAIHRFRVDDEWRLVSAGDNPPGFGVVLQPPTVAGPAAGFFALTGEVGNERGVDAASLLITETGP